MEFLKEIGAIWEHFLTEAKTQSDYSGSLRKASKAETTENEDSILDSAEVIDENNSAIVELAEMLSNLEERISELEGGNNG